MTNIVAFEGANVPAFAKTAAPGNLADVKLGAGFPAISLKGKVFSLRDGDNTTIINRPGTEEPANALEVVILDIGPSSDRKVNAKVWYASGYEEGRADKPDCSSVDGVKPTTQSKNKQAEKCELCPKNVWGTGDKGEGTECRSSKRLAIAMPDKLDRPMLLVVPPTSLGGLGEYLQWLKKSGVQDSAHVITKISFDYTVAHQKLTFKGLGWALTDPTEAKASETVAFITGKKEMPRTEETAEEAFEAPKPEFAKAEKAAKPKTAKPKADDSDPPSEPKVKAETAVDGTKAPAPAAVVATDGDMDDALDDLDFDDN